MTNDNASNNFASAKAVAKRLAHHQILGDWKALDRNLSCYGHVVQLGVEDFMSAITQKAVVETKQAIWDYDPKHADSIVNGGLDVIAILRTLAVKVR
ncbi:hypothetical protein LXA43DRAFT_893277 [Ganoderma leucocontextum]|nr:hypothetical protein LXA43DRAFT_893277 [Ganoderma leucocontextum]